MIWHPKVGERVVLGYRAGLNMDINGAAGTVMRVGRGPGGYATVHELVTMSGRCNANVRRQITLLKEQGRIEIIRIAGTAIDGKACRVPAYRIKAG
jgi:hypothetical protein